MNMKTVLKSLAELILVLLIIAGFIMIIMETPADASVWEIVAINGGGVALLCTSLLILSKISDSDDYKYQQKGGKYYGL